MGRLSVCGADPGLRRFGPLDDNYGHVAPGLRAVLVEEGVLRRLLAVEALVFVAGRLARARCELLGAVLDCDLGIGRKIEVPGRVIRAAALGGDDDETITVLREHERRDVRLA